MAAHHRHRDSLEEVLVFPKPSKDKPDKDELEKLWAPAADIFTRLVRFFQPTEHTYKGYKRVTLLNIMSDEVEDKEMFLRYMFTFLEKDCFGLADDQNFDLSLAISHYEDFEEQQPRQQQFEKSFSAFADHLITAFFIPST